MEAVNVEEFVFIFDNSNCHSGFIELDELVHTNDRRLSGLIASNLVTQLPQPLVNKILVILNR